MPRITLSLLLILLAPLPADATEASPAGLEFFEKHIRPVLSDRCYQCHSTDAEKLKGGLLLDSRDGVLKGGKDGIVLVAGDPEKSKLIEAIRYDNSDLRMPPKHQLSKDEVAAFEQWVKMGAPDPRSGSPPSLVSLAGPYDYEKEKRFWAFQPVKDVTAPQVQNESALSSPIDYFLQADYESHGLLPVGPAEKRALIRRATYDLTGLPPTPDEVDAFLADNSSNAFAKLVDRLLASPRYGEQWGRHWLDLVRYADTSGCNSDYPVPQLYKYRNYVIDAFNKDKPYDQFLKEQLAGDLLPANDDARKREHIIATGYLADARRFGSRNAEFHLTIEDTIDNLGKTMLGLSVSCARCHDHKFDPIPTSDYYALYGIFASTKYAFPGTEIYKHPKDFVSLGTPEETEKLRDYETKLAELDDRIEKLVQERAPLLARQKAAEKAATTQPTTQPVEVVINGRTLKQVLAEMNEAREEQKKLEYLGPPNVDRAYAVHEGKAHDSKVQKKGDPTSPGDVVSRGFLTILGGQKLPDSEKGSGRLELAQWVADASNPLTARVMVNRIWQYHFGKGIVPSPNDFGHRGQPPTNPALLDYLAKRFVDGGWSVKSMHKLLMLSRAYRMASVDDPADQAIDPNNAYLWHFNVRRLSAEEIRDSVLVVNGSMDWTIGGPHPFAPESEWHYTQHKPFVADYPSTKRSIYLMQQRIRKQPYLATFDGADTNATTPDRALSTTAIQALFMMNDPFMHDQADKLAVRIGMALGDEQERIKYAYQLLYARMPSGEEIALGQQYLRAAEIKMKQSGVPWDHQYRAALGSYLRVLLSGNEFMWLD